MPAFFIHGVPDTHHLWDALRSHLSRRDIVAPSLPGFASPLPDGFVCTKEAYLDWLIAEIEKVGEPLDLVGHDWGSILALRIVSVRPDLVRTWAVGDGPIDSTYLWHDTAKLWQTPGAGEQLMASLTPDVMAPVLVANGVPEAAARETAHRIDERMKACILPLYRSAVDVGVEWEPDLLRVKTPGLVLWGGADPYVPVEFGRRLAERTGAAITVFEGGGHWWPQQFPAEAAAALERLWADV